MAGAAPAQPSVSEADWMLRTVTLAAGLAQAYDLVLGASPLRHQAARNAAWRRAVNGLEYAVRASPRVALLAATCARLLAVACEPPAAPPARRQQATRVPTAVAVLPSESLAPSELPVELPLCPSCPSSCPSASRAAALPLLPLDLALDIFARLPADALLQCVAVSRAWRALAASPELGRVWRNLDLSRGSGVGAVCDRLLLQSAAAASLSGGPQSLDLSGWRRLPVSTAALVRVAREHASTLRALRLVTSGPAGEPLDGAVVAALIEAAPGLVVLHARVWVVSLFGVGAFSLAALRLLGPLPGALSIDELAVYSRDDVDAASVGEDEEREEGLRRLRLMPAGGGSAGGATTAAAAAADADDVAGLEGVGEEERPGDAPATLSELVAALQARPALRRLFEVQPAAAAPQGEGGRAAAWWAELWRPPAVSPSHPRLAGRLLCG